MTRQSYELILTALPSDIPASVRLQRALKFLLRAYQSRCKSVKPVVREQKRATKARKEKDHDA